VDKTSKHKIVWTGNGLQSLINVNTKTTGIQLQST